MFFTMFVIGRTGAKRLNAGVVFTHGPTLRFVAPDGPLFPAKFHLDRLRNVGLRPQNLENLEFYPWAAPGFCSWGQCGGKGQGTWGKRNLCGSNASLSLSMSASKARAYSRYI